MEVFEKRMYDTVRGGVKVVALLIRFGSKILRVHAVPHENDEVMNGTCCKGLRAWVEARQAGPRGIQGSSPVSVRG